MRTRVYATATLLALFLAVPVLADQPTKAAPDLFDQVLENPIVQELLAQENLESLLPDTVAIRQVGDKFEMPEMPAGARAMVVTLTEGKQKTDLVWVLEDFCDLVKLRTAAVRTYLKLATSRDMRCLMQKMAKTRPSISFRCLGPYCHAIKKAVPKTDEPETTEKE